MKLGSFEVQIGQRQPEIAAVQPIPQIADKPMSESPKDSLKPRGLSEDELNHLMITDPAGYEQLLMNESEDMVNGEPSNSQ